MLTSGEELLALGADGWALAQLAERERAFGARTRAAAAAAGLARAAAMLAGGAGLAGVVWTGAVALRAGRIGGVEFGVLIFLALGVAGTLQGLPDAVARLPVGRASLERLAAVGRVPPPVTGQTPGVPDAARAPCARQVRQAPTVALKGAALAYPGHRGADRGPVLGDLDLELTPGRPVALAGPSGSGKTSVIFALLRFTELAAGRLTIDGTDARSLPPDSVRALMAWSPEQPALFPASLRANMRVAAPHASDGQITDLLRQLRLGPWLDRLELGLDTVLAPWGQPVSGGERQRLSVARALLAERAVLLLDEPTSHLDVRTAEAVVAAVLERAAGRSLLWVTHRPEELILFPVARNLPAPLAG
jgi:ATP-binding cassette subfamily C protein CydCD